MIDPLLTLKEFQGLPNHPMVIWYYLQCKLHSDATLTSIDDIPGLARKFRIPKRKIYSARTELFMWGLMRKFIKGGVKFVQLNPCFLPLENDYPHFDDSISLDMIHLN